MGTAGGDEQLGFDGGGIVTLHLDIGDYEPVELELHKVAYVLEARCNILSLSYIGEKAGLKGWWSKYKITLFTSQRCKDCCRAVH